MSRRSRRRLVIGGALLGAAVCAAFVYLLLWGQLSPYSPIVTGFDKRELSHVVVYVEKGAERGAGPREFDWADALVDGVEAAHTLRFKSKPRLLFFTDPDTYAARTTTKARMCTYPHGAIVVSPWVQEEDVEGVLSLEVYMRHELSHALLYQHMGILAALRYPEWLLEGVATWSADQRGTFVYPGKDETYALIGAGNWMPPEVFGTAGEDGVRLDTEDRMTFMYSEFACIVEDLVARYGRETFFAYVKSLMEESDHDAVFLEAFDTEFDSYLVGFRSRVEEAAGRVSGPDAASGRLPRRVCRADRASSGYPQLAGACSGGCATRAGLHRQEAVHRHKAKGRPWLS
jgi:predicted SprT family Zn-dependent metalloprotease